MTRAAQWPAADMRWPIAANAVFLIGGLLAYYTSLSLVLVAAVAAAIALPGLAGLKKSRTDAQCRLWLDRAMSAVMGTWALAAIIILVPYISIEEGHTLWATKTLATISVVVASLGTLAWNAAAYQGLAHWDDVRAGRVYALFHVAAVIGAIVLIATGDGALHDVTVRGQTVAMLDLSLAPALAAIPGLVWTMALWRTDPDASQSK